MKEKQCWRIRMEDFIIEYQNSSGLLFGKISRPEKRNAVNFRVMDGLEAMLEKAEKDPSVKAVAIAGEGERAFCAGGDVVEFHRLKTGEEALSMLSRMGNILYRLATLPKPTIALINGHAVGGGCEMAAACDFRIAKSGAKLGFIQANLAITTGWGGGSLLYERLGPSLAFKLLAEADMHTATEMKSYGFIHEIFSNISDETACCFMENILSKDPGVIEAYKIAMIEKFQAVRLKERMDNEIKRCSRLWGKEKHLQAVSEFLKR
jgi:enoyl-CoA hydratase/carnithine racemase